MRDDMDGAGAMPATMAAVSRPAFPDRVLVVEDNLLIAMDIEDMMTAMGAGVVDVASSVAGAMAAIDAAAPDCAVLDVNLGAETSIPVAERLAAAGVPLLFVSGYGDGMVRPDALAGAPVIAKPFTGGAMAAAIRTLLSGD
ncbi:response regulator [Jannaschia sp. LMIT008]|uniref:response regulator n=1 Tax=Jannaschia maritima TaxID=3032585 RepID=UPI0028120251|nr:response regulator [Jannaschia sp. LMIT008]